MELFAVDPTTGDLTVQLHPMGGVMLVAASGALFPYCHHNAFQMVKGAQHTIVIGHIFPCAIWTAEPANDNRWSPYPPRPVA